MTASPTWSVDIVDNLDIVDTVLTDPHLGVEGLVSVAGHGGVLVVSHQLVLGVGVLGRQHRLQGAGVSIM